MSKADLEAVRLFMERIHAEANALADRIDPRRTRKSRSYVRQECIQALDLIGGRARWIATVFKAEGSSPSPSGAERG